MKLYYVLGWGETLHVCMCIISLMLLLIFFSCMLSLLGLPVVIVAVTLAVTLDHYKAEEYCWLNIKSAVIWAFAGPVLFVLSVSVRFLRMYRNLNAKEHLLKVQCVFFLRIN